MTMRNALSRFVLPEAELSLKVVFDNVRNYLICGALLGMALWFRSGKATAPPLIFNGPPKDGWVLLTWFASVVFVLLYFLNLYQSYLIARRFFPFLSTEQNAGPTKRVKLPIYIEIVVLLLAMVLTGVILTLGFAGLLFAIYVPWFAASGSRAV
jgi:hypothetical protein